MVAFVSILQIVTPTPTGGGSRPGWWFQHPPSAEWQWFTLVLAITGFGIAVVALSTALQMFWGRPKVDIHFENDGGSEGRLSCDFGQPFVAGWLHHLGVYRQSIEINVAVSLKRISTGEMIVTADIPELIHLNGYRAKFMQLTSSILSPVRLILTTRAPNGQAVFLREKEHLVLAPETYEVEIIVFYLGRGVVKQKRSFFVAADGTVSWLGPDDTLGWYEK